MNFNHQPVSNFQSLGFVHLSHNIEVKVEPDITMLLSSQEPVPLSALINNASAATNNAASNANSPSNNSPNTKSPPKNPHPCERCGKVFGRKDHLTRHKKTVHSRPATLLCRGCDKIFATTPEFESHFKDVHPGTPIPHENPSGLHDASSDDLPVARIFRCGQCGKSFNRNDHLNRHIKFVHTQDKSQDKKFECFQCGEKFRTNNETKNHMETVHMSVGLSYDCPQCFKPFPNYVKLKKHVESTHIRNILQS